MNDAGRIAAGIGIALSSSAIFFLLLAIAQRPSAPEAAPTVLEASADGGVAPVATPAPDAPARIAPVAPPTSPPAAGSYALDGLPRDGALVVAGCPEVPLIDRAGEPIPWRPPLRIHAAFEQAVRALERAIREASIETYGIPPVRILSASSYRCTTVRSRPERVSEHALGNAIDVRGIVLGESEEVTVREHWGATGEDAIHARFWRALVQRVLDRAIFRGVIGPPTGDHLDHLHFDLGPSTYVALELGDPLRDSP